MTKREFKKNQMVTVSIKTKAGVTTGTGKVTGFPGTEPGQNRYTVKLSDGKIVKPFASQMAVYTA